MTNIFSTSTVSTYLRNGMSSDITGFKTPIGTGVYQQVHYQYNVTPSTLNTDYIAGSAAGGTGTQRVYETGSTVASEQFSVVFRNNSWAVVKGGDKYMFMDCSRVPSVTFSAATLALTTIKITGADNNLKPVIAESQIPVGTVGQFNMNKSFYLINGVYFSSDPGVNLCVGNSNKIGLPHFVPHENYIHNVKWNGAEIDPLQFFYPGYIWRNTSNDRLNANYLTPTSYTIDAHGIIDLGTQTNQPDGTRMLSVYYYVYGTDAELYAQAENSINNNASKVQYRTPISQIPLVTNTSGSYIFPYLVEQDLTGAQYPADEPFMIKYRAALAL